MIRDAVYCHSTSYVIELAQNTIIFAVPMCLLLYNFAKRYQQQWNTTRQPKISRYKMFCLLMIAWYTPFVLFFYMGACDSDFSFLLAIVGIPIWIYGWMRWFFTKLVERS